ncbi:hypothetical protein [Actomonas aquatica]|uniref:Uncharacterized protein n=1 Tax=Actomonas aquatica TaxID=2866162 RepID=A0ABZ1CA22_9BACT|nr:hypothetical protein [Opitutus sp. WL0086]WRQ88220.1 hypothetical protein K1X11_002300 [Opitutus sp. WL0086]
MRRARSSRTATGAAPCRAARLARGLGFGLLATCALAQTTPPADGSASSATERNVTATAQGLENLELLQKGIVRDGGAGDLSPSSLLSGSSLDQKTARASLPLAPTTGTTDETTRLELQRQQWARENWLIDGMRQTTRSADEGTLLGEALGLRHGQAADTTATAGAPGTSTATTDAGSTDYWLAIAVEAQTGSSASGQNESDDEADASEDRISPDDAENPLGDFLADWLTADSQRLIDSRDQISLNAENAAPTSGSRSAVLDFGTETLSRDELGGFFAGRNRAPATGQDRGGAAVANPFLAAMDADAAFLGAGGPFTGFAPAPAPAATDGTRTLQPLPLPGTTGVPGAATTNGTPDSTVVPPAKEPWVPPAREDEKYFPRLKRF